MRLTWPIPVWSAGCQGGGRSGVYHSRLFILNKDAEFSILKVMLVTVGGTVLGLIFTSLIRKHFVVEADMPYAMGQAAAEVVVVGDEGGQADRRSVWFPGDRRSLDRPAGLVCRRPPP